LGDITGILVAEEIRERNEKAVLIFISAYESYCKELFRFDVTDFLEKPIDEARVRELLPRIGQKLHAPLKTFTYRVNETVCRVPLADILFFEKESRRIKLVLRQKEEFFYGKLDEVEASLIRSSFARIHQSFLVNLDNVERFEHNTLFMRAGYILPISQRKLKEARRIIMEYFSFNAMS
jgi:DNA-binding LytR/AlgR family response regulator